MAAMYASRAMEIAETINLAAYEDADGETKEEVKELVVDCDDRSTRASSGGSDHASSDGSDDDSSEKTPTMKPKREGHVVKHKLRASAPEFHFDMNALVAPVQPIPQLPTLLTLPPGLEPPPGLEHLASMLPPGLEHPAKIVMEEPKPVEIPYTRKEFRRTMTAIFNEIRQSRTAALNEPVDRVRSRNVPQSEQPALFSEMMTRAVEEMSGPGRRLCMAFVTGIAAGSPSAFTKEACLAGIKIFFQEVYDDLMTEVPKLQIRVEREFLPVLRTAFAAREINEVLPPRLRVAP